jgi:hypothetical protein
MTDIRELQDSDEPYTRDQMNVMPDLFAGSSQGGSDKAKYSPLIFGVLFFVLNLPIVNELLKKVIATSDMILLVIKSVFYVVILFILKWLGF